MQLNLELINAGQEQEQPYCSGYMLHHKETPAHEIHYNSQKLLYCFTQNYSHTQFLRKRKTLTSKKSN